MKLTKKDFIAWVKAQPEDAVVGTARIACKCPLARYLAHKTGTGWSVMPSPGDDEAWYAHNFSGPGIKRLPRWAERFAEAVDEGVEPICSRARALAILEG